MSIPRVLTIAGSAAQGSAGIQADLKTFEERDVYGMSVITAIVANHSKTEKGIFINSLEAIEAQFYSSYEHVGFDALKTGMLFTKDIIERVSQLIRESGVQHVVVDPVMIGKMGSQLLKGDAIDTLVSTLFPLAAVITPNLHEAIRLTGKTNMNTVEDMKEAAKELYELGPSYILVKGGTLKEGAIDVLYDGNDFIEFRSERIDTIHTSGAGCSYSAAIASELAKGKNMIEAVAEAKTFVTYAIKHALSFNRGIGSTYHGAMRKYGNHDS